jgi:hypothetical protein
MDIEEYIAWGILVLVWVFVAVPLMMPMPSLGYKKDLVNGLKVQAFAYPFIAALVAFVWALNVALDSIFK